MSIFMKRGGEIAPEPWNRITLGPGGGKFLHQKAGYMTDALFSSKNSLDAYGWPIHDNRGGGKFYTLFDRKMVQAIEVRITLYSTTPTLSAPFLFSLLP